MHHRRAGGEALGELPGLLLGLGRGHDAVEEADRLRRVGVDHVAGEHELERLAHADQARQGPGAAAVGHEPALDEDLAEAGALGADAQVAGERQIGAVADRGAVDQRHHRLLDAAHGADEPVEIFAHVLFDVVHGAHAAGGHRLQVEPAAEVAALAGHDDAADRLVGGGAVERVDERLIDCVGQPVLGLGPIEHDPAHGRFVRHFYVAHSCVPPPASLAEPVNAWMPATTYWMPLTTVSAADMMPKAPTNGRSVSHSVMEWTRARPMVKTV